MAAVSPERVIRLDQALDPADHRVIEDGPYASFEPAPGHEDRLAAALLAPRPHLQCWRKRDIPARFRYGSHPRIPAWLCLADIGWIIRAKPAEPDWAIKGGNHGWDNHAPEMRALFLAHGPAFAGERAPAVFDNVEVYPLLRALLGLPPAQRTDAEGVLAAQLLAGR